MNDHLKAQQVLNDSMSKLREMFQTWLQQRQEQVVNLDTYTPEPSQLLEEILQVHIIHLLQSQKEKLEQQKAKAKEEVASLKARPSYPDINQLTELLFASMVENTSGATTKDVPSAGQSIALPAEGEKNANPATTNVEPNLHDELMLKDENVPIYKSEMFFTQKGPISLKVHRKDSTIEVISNIKVSDLHLAE
ncbi:hypothetical protein Tco_0988414 [Tanacetum coccineum]|uniref:Uncharacterized protein n=1 Tax=Tanacetum coccineum TaxID=301880 RepID=A0ABQ5ER23_9ASTR